MLNKRYLPFFAILGLFLIVLIYSVVLYAKWDNEIQNGVSVVEISLPVMDWDAYSELSKQHE